MIDADAIEREILGRIKAAKLELRFDKVVARLVGGLKAALAGVVAEGQAVVFTVAAPIKLPAKTAAALEGLLRDCPPGGERREVLHGNPVRVRRLAGVAPHMPKALGFVHNPKSDAGLILDLAAARLLSSPRVQPRERQGEARGD
jgi:hypothetical protein